MMRRGASRIFGVVLGFLVLVALFHSVMHFSAFGTGIDGFYKSGMSGLAVGKFNIGEELQTRYSGFSFYSKVILIVEWLFVLLLISIVLLKNRVTIQTTKVNESLGGLRKRDKSKVNTDLDVLYSFLKENRSVKLSHISKLFGIDREQVNDWCNILESGNLASVIYPRFGEPELRLNEVSLIKND